MSSNELSKSDVLWAQAVYDVIAKLSKKNTAWLLDEDNQKPFTASQLIVQVAASHSANSGRLLQRWYSKIDPILSHISSLQNSVNVVVQNDIMVTGTIWAAFHLLIQVSCRAEQLFQSIIESTWDLIPQLNLFNRWRQLFPDKDFMQLAECVRQTFVEILEFWVDSIAFLRHGTLVKRLVVLFKPRLEANFRRKHAQISKLTRRVKVEVETAHMQSVKKKLNTITTLIRPDSADQAMKALPQVRLITHSQNQMFFGREGVLGQIHDALKPRELSQQRRFVLYGPKGAGKTQVACEYTYRNLDSYKAIIWIVADSMEKIDQGFRDAAILMGIPAKDSSQAKAYVLQRLSSSADEFLLCFDNVDDLAIVCDCLPRSTKGSILITTRNATWPDTYSTNSVMLQDFDQAEGCDYLASMLPHIDKESPSARRHLEQISASFQGYPLGLSQVAGFIRTGGCALSDFLTVFKDKKASTEILALPVKDYDTTFVTIWLLSQSSLSDNAKKLLNILSFLDPDSIPCELFKKGAERTDRNGDQDSSAVSFLAEPLAYHGALQGLAAQSFVRLNLERETISIHRYLQSQSHEHLCSDRAAHRSAFEAALHLLTKTQRNFDNANCHMSEKNWAFSARYVPHIKALGRRFVEHPGELQGYENQLGVLIYQCAVYQFEKFHHQAASESFHMAIKVFSLSESPDIVVLSDCKRIEGRMLNEINQPGNAASANHMALYYAEQAVERGLMTEDDGRIPRILTGFGNSMSQLRDFDRATELQLRALKMARALPSSNDALKIVQLNWGFLLWRMGKSHEAEQVLRQSLDVDPSQPMALYPLGNTLLSLKRIDEGLAAHLRALELYIERFGPQHAITGVSLYKVGTILLQHKHQPREAITYLRRSLACYQVQDCQYYKKASVARGSRMLGIALKAVGEDNEAQALLQRARDLKQEVMGPKHHGAETDEDYTAMMFYWDH